MNVLQQELSSLKQIYTHRTKQLRIIRKKYTKKGPELNRKYLKVKSSMNLNLI